VGAHQVAREDRLDALAGERLGDARRLPAPRALRAVSSWPCMRISAFQSVSPWRTATTRVTSSARSFIRGGG
jgi:hypothetical protein